MAPPPPAAAAMFVIVKSARSGGGRSGDSRVSGWGIPVLLQYYVIKQEKTTEGFDRLISVTGKMGVACRCWWEMEHSAALH